MDDLNLPYSRKGSIRKDSNILIFYVDKMGPKIMCIRSNILITERGCYKAKHEGPPILATEFRAM